MDEPNNKYHIPIMLGLAAFTAILSIPEIPLPPGPRQAELLYKGWAVLEGQLPYKDFWDNGSPGVFYIYALALKLFGHRYESINILDIIWRAATSVALYMLAKRLFGRLEGMITSVLYAIALATVGSSWQWNALPESFMLLPLAFGIYFYLDDNNIGANVLSGLLLGIASIIKLPAFLFVLMVAAFAMLTPRATWEPRPRRAKMFSFLYGVIIVFTFLLFYLLLSWSIKDFFIQTISYNFNIASAPDPILDFIEKYYFLAPFWLMVWFSKAERRRNLLLVSLWLLLSVVLLYAQRFNQAHTYWASCFFIPLGPGVLLGAGGIAFLLNYAFKNASWSRRGFYTGMTILWLILYITLWPLFFGRLADWNGSSLEYLSGRTDRENYLSHFVDNTFDDFNIFLNEKVGLYIYEHTSRGDKINASAMISFIAERPLPWRPFFPNDLSLIENSRYLKEYIETSEKEYSLSPPVYLVIIRRFDAPVDYLDWLSRGGQRIPLLRNKYILTPEIKFGNYAALYRRK